MAEEKQRALDRLKLEVDAVHRALMEVTDKAFTANRLLSPEELSRYEELIRRRDQLTDQIAVLRGVPQYKPEPYKGPIY